MATARRLPGSTCPLRDEQHPRYRASITLDQHLRSDVRAPYLTGNVHLITNPAAGAGMMVPSRSRPRMPRSSWRDIAIWGCTTHDPDPEGDCEEHAPSAVLYVTTDEPVDTGPGADRARRISRRVGLEWIDARTGRRFDDPRVTGICPRWIHQLALNGAMRMYHDPGASSRRRPRTFRMYMRSLFTDRPAPLGPSDFGSRDGLAARRACRALADAGPPICLCHGRAVQPPAPGLARPVTRCTARRARSQCQELWRLEVVALVRPTGDAARRARSAYHPGARRDPRLSQRYVP